MEKLQLLLHFLNLKYVKKIYNNFNLFYVKITIIMIASRNA